MMGSGKTVTANALATSLGYTFVDLDTTIRLSENLLISEIFAQKGEPYFRDAESSALEHVSKKAKQVVATGGGIVLREANIQRMKETGTVILLQASVESLWQRVQYSKDRPLLNKPDPFGTLRKILNDRGVLYEKACHFLVATDGKTAEKVAGEIFKILRSKT